MARRYWILLAVCLPIYLFGETLPTDPITPPTPMSSVAGIPSSLIGGCVNAIAGDFALAETDIVAEGPEPLAHQRFYSSARCAISAEPTGTQQIGWSYSYDNYLLFQAVNTVDKAVTLTAHVREPTGASLPYQYKIKKGSPNKVALTLHPDLIKQGLTNCYAGDISGRTQMKNTRVVFDNDAPDNTLKVVFGSGTERIYAPETWLKPKDRQPDMNLLQYERKPSGRLINYTYNLNSTSSEIHATNADKSAVLGSLSYYRPPGIDYDNVPDFTQSIAAHDSTQAKVTFTKYSYKDRRGGTRAIFTPTEVESTAAPKITYTYSSGGYGHAPRISARILPDGRSLNVEYYVPGVNLVANRNIAVTRDHQFPLGRVRKLLAPVGTTDQPLEVASFLYEQDWIHTKNSKGQPKAVDDGGHTTVYDALGHKTVYRFSKDQRLTNINYFDVSENLHHAQSYTWGASESPLAGNLLNSTFSDTSGNALVFHSYTYDERGNIIQEVFQGNITGTGSTDQSVKTYEHSTDGFNLVLKESDCTGKCTLYRYLAGTDLLTAKLTGHGDHVYSREFYRYDHNGLVVLKIADDGSGQAPEDLTNVTQRHLITIHPRTEAPGLGLPGVIEQQAFDIQTGETHILQRTVRNYTPQGWILSEDTYDADGVFAGRSEYTYDSHGNVLTERNPLGHTIRREYDANDNKVKEVGPRPGQVTRYGYDFSDRLIREEIDVDGKVLANTYAYDLCSRIKSSTDIYGNTTTYEYDPFGNCTRASLPTVVDENGNSATPLVCKAYDCIGNVTSITDPKGYTLTTTYTAHGKPVEIVHPDGTKESFRYTIDGLLSTHVGKNGAVTSYTYDPQRRVLTEEVAFQGEVLKATSNTYDRTHLVATTDAEGHTTRYQYDFAGRLYCTTKENGAENIATVIEYDASGRQRKVIEGAGTEAAVAHVKEYDLLGQVIEERVEDARGRVQRQSSYTYDEAGNRTTTTVATAEGMATTCVEYDLLNKPVTVIDALGHATTTAYNHRAPGKDGRYVLQTTETDPLGHRTITTYESRGLVASVETLDAFGVLTSQREFYYDIIGNRCREVDTVLVAGQVERNFELRWRHGPMGRVEEVMEGYGDPLQKTTQYIYDPCGQMQSIVKPDGVRLEHRYDHLGRLIAYYGSDHSFSYRYTYDCVDNLIKIDDLVCDTATTRTYDPLQQVVSEEQATGLALSYARDAVGRPVKTVLPDRTSIHYVYDGVNLSAVEKQDAAGVVKYRHSYLDYDLTGRLMQAQGICAVGSFEYQYDLVGRATKISAPGYRVEVPVGGYDPVGNMLACSIEDMSGHSDCGYSYDPLNQLKSERGVVQHDYEHDSIHNRRGKDDKEHWLNGLNQLEFDGQTRFRYDPNGNLISSENPDRKVAYRYDALDRVVGVDIGSEKRIAYRYDSFNRRIGKRVEESRDGAWKQVSDISYLYDGQNEIGAVDPSGEVVELRILGFGRGAEIGAAVAVELGGSVYGPVHSMRGDIVGLVDVDTGETVQGYRYSAFGEEKVIGEETWNPWRFCSKRVDPDTNLVCFGRRDYDPITGRWVTPDPAGFGDGPNLYAYVHNSPLVHVDLYGLISSGMQDSWLKSGRSWDSRSWLSINRPKRDSRPTRGTAQGSFRASETRQPKRLTHCLPSLSDFANATGISEFFGRIDHPSYTHHFGENINDEKERVTFTLGINNRAEDSDRTAMMMSAKHGGTRVDYTHSATHGFFLDFLKCVLGKFGYKYRAARMQAKLWRKIIAEMGGAQGGGKIQHYAHSQGGITTWLALKMLEPDEKKMINVQTFGSGMLILDEECGGAINYISKGDTVRFVNMGRLLFSKPNVVYLEPTVRSEFDHGFARDTYQQVVDELGEEYTFRTGAIH